MRPRPGLAGATSVQESVWVEEARAAPCAGVTIVGAPVGDIRLTEKLRVAKTPHFASEKSPALQALTPKV